GWATWIRLPAALAGLSALVAQRARYAHLSATVTSGLHMLWSGPTPAAIAQLAAALGAAAAIWLGFRRGFAPLPTAALLVGAFFVTPYAFYYDLPMVSYAVLAVVIERHRSSAAFRTWELPILILAVALPLLMLFDVARVPWGIVVLPLLFWLILRRMAVINHVAHACLA
ncbi:MAG: hypothetical protein ACREFY_12180, partial [Acetobacteraceae bacterium]